MQTTEFFKALSDPTRLAIIQLLREQESLCVCDIVTSLEQPQPTVSRHLNHLKRIGLLDSQRRGTWMWYGLSNQLEDWQKAVIKVLPNDTV